MLKQRILTALFGLPALLYLLLNGSVVVLWSMYAAFIVISVWEISGMLIPKLELLFLSASEGTPYAVKETSRVDVWMLALFGVATLASFVYFPHACTGVIVILAMACILSGALLAEDVNTAIGHALGYLMSYVYGTLPWLLIWDLGQRGHQSSYTILLLSIVWSGDTGAYFGGKFFGKHKLAPLTSPNKTWEGAIAGIVASALGGYLANACWNFQLGSSALILITAIIGGFAGQLGDLVESSFKRFAQIKNSGTLFPGHGGFLDRCDGLLFAAPIVWLILQARP